MTLTEELMTAALTAPDERKTAALRLLRGEVVDRATKTTSGPLLLSMGAGAKLLGVSRATLWRAVKAGKLTKVELFPGSFRVRREDLEELVTQIGEKGAVCGGQFAEDSESTLTPTLSPPREREKRGKAVAA